MSRTASPRSARLVFVSRPPRGMGSRKTKNAETRNVQASTPSANASWSTRNADSAVNDPSHAATTASSEKTMDANGNVAYEATSDNVFADWSWPDLTMCGTDASFAGPHKSVRISSANEMRTKPSKFSTNGSNSTNEARPTSQTTMTLR